DAPDGICTHPPTGTGPPRPGPAASRHLGGSPPPRGGDCRAGPSTDLAVPDDPAPATVRFLVSLPPNLPRCLLCRTSPSSPAVPAYHGAPPLPPRRPHPPTTSA